MTIMEILKGKTISELEEIFNEIGQRRFRGKQAFLRINKHLARRLDEFSEFPKSLRQEIQEANAFPDMPMLETSRAFDGTEKALFGAGMDKRDEVEKQIEAVWIASESDRNTICISSQVGCTLNCSFCATGTLKFRGNLETYQILDQVYSLILHRDERPTNIVFMGMGEPFHNYDNVLKAARILNHTEGLNIGARHITISTAGVVPAIHRYIDEKQPFNLAISLNQADAKTRGEIMDVDRKFPLKDLLEAAKRYTRELKRRITFEYVLIPDVNMSDVHGRQLIKIARSLNCKINLIPLNTTLQGWRRPSANEVIQFQNQLKSAGLLAFNRGSPGLEVDGACGMLALKGA